MLGNIAIIIDIVAANNRIRIRINLLNLRIEILALSGKLRVSFSNSVVPCTLLRRFDELEPRTGRAAAYKAVVMIFPQVPLSHAPRLIDGVQLALKPEFVARGLMIGEFHLRDAISATHFWTVTPRRGYDDAHSS